jgi:Cu2+-exporting ATPase
MTETVAVPGAAPDEPHHLDGIEGYVASDGRLHRLALLAEGVHCGGCVRKIERALEAEPGVTEARVNLTTRRLNLAWRGAVADGRRLVETVEALGFRLVPFDVERARDDDAAERRALLRAMGIAGFAAANVMLLSVAVWAGHAQGMTETTRALLHWFSALVALPAIAVAGQPFFRSAIRSLRARHTNMDVPISLAVILAPAVSLF